MDSSRTAAIEVQRARKSFGAIRAIDGVDLTIDRGEFFGLLGANGAGKSTLLNIVAGLTRADAGSAAVLGHDVVKSYREARRSLGFVPQELVFDAFLTVRESLVLQAGYFGLRRKAAPWIDELMHALGLTDKANSEMRALSGGMKRRVLLAQALVHKPPVIVLDEPTAGVDLAMRNGLWTLLRRLQTEGHTFVLTTHHLEEAESLCDRLAFMKQGRIVALGRREELRSHARVRTLRIELRDDGFSLPSMLAGLGAIAAGRVITMPMNTNADDVSEVVNALCLAGARITSVDLARPRLEDAFISLTSEAAE